MPKNASQLVAFLEDLKDGDVLKESAKNFDIPEPQIIKGGVKEALKKFVTVRAPLYLIIDISNSELPLSDLTQLIEVCDPAVSIIAVGTKNDVGLYRDLIELGISDYIVRPLFPDILNFSLKGMLFGEERGEEPKKGKLIGVIGSRGGVGATFLTTNIAALISEEYSRRIAVLDLDLHFGTVSLYFNMKPTPGLADALENPSRIDKVIIDHLLKPVNSRLYIMSSQEPLDIDIQSKIEAVEILLNHLLTAFHYVIVDIPHSSNEVILEIISKLQLMFVVSDFSLQGFRDTKRLVDLFGKEGPGRQLSIIVNKYNEYTNESMNISDIEDSIKHKVGYSLPYEPLITHALINQGKSLANENNILSRNLREIVDNIFGMKKAEIPQSWFQKLFKR